MKKYFWIAWVVSLCLFMGCTAPSHPEELVDARVGEKMYVEKLSVTVTNITRPIPNPADTVIDQDIILVALLVLNEGKHAFSFKMEELYLKNEKGDEVQGYPQGGPGSLLSTGRYLAMGDRITGTLSFSIPKGAGGYTLYYKPAKLRGRVYRLQIPQA